MKIHEYAGSEALASQRPSARSPRQVPKVDWLAWQRPPLDMTEQGSHTLATPSASRASAQKPVQTHPRSGDSALS